MDDFNFLHQGFISDQNSLKSELTPPYHRNKKVLVKTVYFIPSSSYGSSLSKKLKSKILLDLWEVRNLEEFHSKVKESKSSSIEVSLKLCLIFPEGTNPQTLFFQDILIALREGKVDYFLLIPDKNIDYMPSDIKPFYYNPDEENSVIEKILEGVESEFQIPPELILTTPERGQEHRRSDYYSTSYFKFRKKVEGKSLIGDALKMNKAYSQFKKVLENGAPLFISGEEGSGKDYYVDLFIEKSQLKGPSIIKINCKPLPGDYILLEVKNQLKKLLNHLEENRENKGVLILNNIHLIKGQTLEKILSHIDSLEELKDRLVLIFTSNVLNQSKDHEKALGLFPKLTANWERVRLRPLREEKEDIPLFFLKFYQKFSKEELTTFPKIEAKAMENLKEYHWPGNLRELENLVERISLLRSKCPILLEDLPSYVRSSKENSESEIRVTLPSEGINLKDFIFALEKQLLREALKRTGGNKNQAAKLLKLNRTTLIEKLKKRGISTSPRIS